MEHEITITQAVQQVGVSRQQLRDKLLRKKLRGRKLDPYRWLVDATDLPADNAAWRARFPPGRPAIHKERA